MAVSNALASKPRWPAGEIDASAIDLDYYPPADELTLYFGGRPVSEYSSAIGAPVSSAVMAMIGLDEADESTGEVVGIHVYPLVAGALRVHPEWRALAEPSPPSEAIAAFIADVADLFARYWTPASSMEEQLARLPRAARGTGARGR